MRRDWVDYGGRGYRIDEDQALYGVEVDPDPDYVFDSKRRDKRVQASVPGVA